MPEKNTGPSGAEHSELPDDPLQRFLKKIAGVARIYQKQLIMAGAGLLCLIVVISGVFYFLSRAQDRASARFLEISRQAEAIDPQQDGQAYDGIKEQYAGLIEDYGYTDAGEMALLRYAALCLETGEPDRALSLYERAWKKLKNNEQFNFLVLNGMAHAHAAMDDFEQAVSYFQRVLENQSTVIDDQALFNLGLLYEKMGAPEKSRQAFEQIVSEYSDSMFADAARARISG
ncbi:MAG: tetratricopeptide repeat protein [Desulfobacterales bacterium]|nr:tetratricopeptide repeat protein [Desulfobacterales bacterium]